MGWKQYFFSFRGRVGRTGFLLYNVSALALVLLLGAAFWMYALSVPGAYENGGPTPLPKGPLGMAGVIGFVALTLTIALAGAAITVKRLHDRDKAWWWIAVFVLAPDALFALGEVLGENEAANASALFLIQFAALTLAVWGTIELAFLRGTVGTNRFGADPLQS